MPCLDRAAPANRRRQEESRLRAKAIREAEQRAAGAAPPLRSASGFVASEHVHVARPAARSNRDGRVGEPPLRPAPSFARFVDYNMSAMTDTKGGFLAAADDPLAHAGKRPADDDQRRPAHMSVQDWERLQLVRSLKRQKTGPFEPGLSVLDDDDKRKRCRECRSLEIDFVWEEVFRVCICNKCKDKFPEKYSLLTKTECKQDYLLTDPELRDPELLPHLSRPNPQKSYWHDMMLFLRCQVEDYALRTKWGSVEALDAEYERRETQKKARKEAKFREKLTDLKRKTRTDAFRCQAGTLGATGARRFGDAVGGPARHVHEWGRSVENDEGMTIKTCVGCGMEVEELEL